MIDHRINHQICLACPFRDHLHKDRCLSDGLSCVKHAHEGTCPEGRYAPPEPSADEVMAFIRGPHRALPFRWATAPAVAQVYRDEMRHQAELIDAMWPSAPNVWASRGVVIVGGGSYAFSALISLKMLRHVGCQLPVEIWAFDEAEAPDWFRAEAERHGAKIKLASDHYLGDPFRARGRHRGWGLKAYALWHSSFAETLYLDADSYPVKDITPLFEHEAFKRFGACFWPDLPETGGTDLPPEVWATLGLPHRDEPEVEAGQFLIDKQRCWRELRLAHWMNQHSEYYYTFAPKFAYGDKFTWHVAWRFMGRNYGMPEYRPYRAKPAMIHLDFDGDELFVHRVNAKFSEHDFSGPYETFKTTHQLPEQRNDTLPLEDVAWSFVEETRKLVPPASKPAPKVIAPEPVTAPPKRDCGCRSRKSK